MNFLRIFILAINFINIRAEYIVDEFRNLRSMLNTTPKTNHVNMFYKFKKGAESFNNSEIFYIKKMRSFKKFNKESNALFVVADFISTRNPESFNWENLSNIKSLERIGDVKIPGRSVSVSIEKNKIIFVSNFKFPFFEENNPDNELYIYNKDDEITSHLRDLSSILNGWSAFSFQYVEGYTNVFKNNKVLSFYIPYSGGRTRIISFTFSEIENIKIPFFDTTMKNTVKKTLSNIPSITNSL